MLIITQLGALSRRLQKRESKHTPNNIILVQGYRIANIIYLLYIYIYTYRHRHAKSNQVKMFIILFIILKFV